ncbi:MAG: IcmF-related protein [Labilithrix sp.]|nr:IcmF-related protein [Labilithrix sp.]
MWAWILAIIVVLGTWTAGWFFDLALWIRIVVTVFAVLFVVGYYVVRRLRAKAAAQSLERELMKQAEQQAANARPDRRAEINELQAQFKKGLASLKSSRLGASAGSALYALPWYMIVGPPGAGKTTAIRHSGLDFPIPDSAGALRGVGGTRNCDWWFTNEAILLDTAGRFATQEDDHEEWTAFLDMLRRHRTKSPVDGVIVAISIADVIGATEEQVETTAKALRARIDEVMTRLQMVMPVYVLFTKCDLIAGFVETFEDLKKSERAQIWGVTFPIDQANLEPGKAFDAEYDTLMESLHGNALRRIASARGQQTRARVEQFPLEMRAVKGALTEFVSALLRKNTFQETPLFRGVYFTSGTQEGRPLDRVMGGMVRAFGLRAQSMPDVGPRADAKSYFLTDVFRRVVFADRFVAARTRGEARRQLFTRIGASASAVALAALVVIPTSVSYGKNRELVRTTTAIAAAAEQIDWSGGGDVVEKLARVEPLRNRLHELETWKKDGAPLSYRWGLYAGNSLVGPLRDDYAAIMQRAFVRPVKTSLEDRLRSLEADPKHAAEDFNRRYDELKKYLMLTEREHLEVDWAAPRDTRHWAELAHVKSPDDEATLQLNVEEYLRLVKSGDVKPAARDEKLVSYVRTELLRTPQVGRLYESLVRDTNTEIAPIRRETIFYGSVAPFVSSKKNVKIDGAYTKLGWSKIRHLLEEERTKLTSEGWVLGTEDKVPDEQINKEVAALRQTYFDRYREAWRDFLADLVIARPASSEGSLGELLALSEPEWPYLRLVRTLAENVELEVSDVEAGKGSLLEQLKDKGKEAAKQKLLGQSPTIDAGGMLLNQERAVSPVELVWKPLVTFGVPAPAAPGAPPPPPTGLSQYQGTLHKLIGVLTDLKDAKAAPDPKALTGEFEAAYRATTALLADQDSFTRPLLTPLLLDPIAFSWASVLRDAGGAAGGLWEISAWKTWSTKLETSYPFAPDATNDAKIEDFVSFFQPEKGQLWAFYDQSLKGSLERQGNDFTPSRRFKAQVPYSNEFLECLRRSAKITDATFGADPKVPAVMFEVNLHSVSPDIAEVTIEVDGVSRTYTNTPEEWLAVTWPAKDAKARGAKVKVRGISGRSEEIVRGGEFGLFHLLDAATIVPGVSGKGGTSAPVLVATWKLKSQPDSNVKIDLKPQKSETALTRGFFAGLKCPRLITQGDR